MDIKDFKTQEELDKHLQVMKVLNRNKINELYNSKEVNKIYNSGYKNFIEKLLKKSNEEILEDIKNKLSFISNSLKENEMIISLQNNNKSDYLKAQLDWAFKQGDLYELETLLQIKRLFNDIGLDITLMCAQEIWLCVSDEYSAQWLSKSDDDECWWLIICNWLYPKYSIK